MLASALVGENSAVTEAGLRMIRIYFPEVPTIERGEFLLSVLL